YVFDTFNRVYAEEMTLANYETPILRDLVASIRNQCTNFTAFVMIESKSDSYLNNYFLQLLYQGKLHVDFINGFISNTYHQYSNEQFRQIFVPILYNLWLDMNSYCSFTYENHYKLPLQVLHDLCNVSVGKSNYPLGEL